MQTCIYIYMYICIFVLICTGVRADLNSFPCLVLNGQLFEGILFMCNVQNDNNWLHTKKIYIFECGDTVVSVVGYFWSNCVWWYLHVLYLAAVAWGEAGWADHYRQLITVHFSMSVRSLLKYLFGLQFTTACICNSSPCHPSLLHKCISFVT